MGRVTRLFRYASLPCKICLTANRRYSAFLLRVELAYARSISGTRHDKIKTRIFAGLNFMGRVTRFELATFGTTNRRSNQLSYTRHNFWVKTWWS